MNRTFRLIVFFLGSLTAVACRPEPPGYDLHQQDSHTSALLIGLSVIDDEVAWASGTDATILRTIDGGGNWEVFRYEEADTLQFRDIHAFSSQEAVVLSVGNGGASQVFRFDVDSGWTRTFQMDDDRGFLDAFDFWPDGQGLAYGDSFDEKPYLLKTEDMGATWFRLAGSLLPDAGPGEGGFASSGTCVETGADGKAWVGTGAGGNARLFFTPDYGDHWEILSTDMVTGEAAGITSVRFDGTMGFITGGDLTIVDERTNNLFFTDNSGRSWYAGASPKTPGAFYGSGFAKIGDRHVTLVVGPKGADLSVDYGQNWIKISPLNLWTCEILPSGRGWMMGKGGKILRISMD